MQSFEKKWSIVLSNLTAKIACAPSSTVRSWGPRLNIPFITYVRALLLREVCQVAWRTLQWLLTFFIWRADTFRIILKMLIWQLPNGKKYCKYVRITKLRSSVVIISWAPVLVSWAVEIYEPLEGGRGVGRRYACTSVPVAHDEDTGAWDVRASPLLVERPGPQRWLVGTTTLLALWPRDHRSIRGHPQPNVRMSELLRR